MPDADAKRLEARDFALTEAAVREAGMLALAHFHAAPKRWSKSDSSPVSEADHAVDRLLHDRLIGLRPDYGWLSEESADTRARIGRERVWIVDPIDGTRAFLKHRPEWVVSVALVEAGRPLIGMLYNPVREQFFAAIRSGGATLNDRPLAIVPRNEIAGARMLADPARFVPEKWRDPWPLMEYERLNALAYRIALVASGQADATVTFGRTHEWDIAAADLILHEAGGRLTDVVGDRVTYNRADPVVDGAIAASRPLHAALTAFIAGNPRVPAARRRAHG